MIVDGDRYQIIAQTDENYENVIMTEKSNIAETAGNDDVYSRTNSYEKIYFIKFYYITFDAKGDLMVRHYTYFSGPETPIPHENLKGRLTALGINAKNNGSSPPPDGDNFIGIVWRHRSYVAFCFDHQSWSFLQGPVQSEDSAVVFRTDKGKPNQAFYDGENMTLDMSPAGGSATTSAFAMINHHTKKKPTKPNEYNLVKGDKIDYKFDLYVRLRFSTDPSAGLTVILDPGGDNEGPTLPPP